MAQFAAWKAAGEAGEYASYLFGKDGGYIVPLVNGQRYVLRHAHLVPLADAAALRIWEAQWRRRSRKTSDRVLIYVSDAAHGHLLIYILEEPTAHAVAKMRTSAEKQVMDQFAAIAEAFILRGEVIA